MPSRWHCFDKLLQYHNINFHPVLHSLIQNHYQDFVSVMGKSDHCANPSPAYPKNSQCAFFWAGCVSTVQQRHSSLCVWVWKVLISLHWCGPSCQSSWNDSVFFLVPVSKHFVITSSCPHSVFCYMLQFPQNCSDFCEVKFSSLLYISILLRSMQRGQCIVTYLLVTEQKGFLEHAHVDQSTRCSVWCVRFPHPLWCHR